MEDITTTFDIDIYKELEAENRDFNIYIDTGPNGIIQINRNFVYEPRSPEGAVLCGNFKTPTDGLVGFFIVLENGAAYLQFPSPPPFTDRNEQQLPYWWNNQYNRYDYIGGFSTICGTTYISWKK